MAGRGFVRQFTCPFCNLTVVGTATPAPRRKYSLLIAAVVGSSAVLCASFSSFAPPASGCACSRAGNTVLFPSQLISQSPAISRVVSSSSHSTISTFVPSLLRPGSNSKRASALLELREGDSTSSAGVAEERTALAEEVSTGLKGGLAEVGALMFGGVRLTRQMSIRGYRVWSIDSLLLCRPQVCCVLKEREETELARLASLVGSVVVVVHGGRY